MNANEIIKNIEAAELKSELPEFQVGDTVKVYGRIVEGNRTRTQVFEGTVIKRQGGSNRETFTVRKSSNGVGVEKTWPLHSPNVEKIDAWLFLLKSSVTASCTASAPAISSESITSRTMYRGKPAG